MKVTPDHVAVILDHTGLDSIPAKTANQMLRRGDRSAAVLVNSLVGMNPKTARVTLQMLESRGHITAPADGWPI